ncbi:hypothetical protein FRACYDRAFT_235360 [Fragilariopsis cylindrus CCMP1102]|uniref:BTB domain-containing protein n=1 Tax=Fragilariopsis cylindrus CCMP1102 TaxID=635003 RepID=A0A1E7FMB3_9STRA|nr:hypothetical protein FRACYDRAFT_235360 [Fragilariopsis cylindrus CCMP1102]|eukprot:OEU19312.1 hypothetical protein FRACYDRAFT_235360 [Fragilariopsis cylindrus CCMP1102]
MRYQYPTKSGVERQRDVVYSGAGEERAVEESSQQAVKMTTTPSSRSRLPTSKITNQRLYGKDKKEEIREDSNCENMDNNNNNMRRSPEQDTQTEIEAREGTKFTPATATRDAAATSSGAGKNDSDDDDDDEEYRILCIEIERIYHRSSIDGGTASSPSGDKSGTISLTSIFSNEAEISQGMHGKIMRLIMAMMPNSSTEQSKHFIRDLFVMGIRVKPPQLLVGKGDNRTSDYSVVSQQKRYQPLRKNAEESRDDFKIDFESNSIIESSVDDSGIIGSIDGGSMNTEDVNKWGRARQKAFIINQQATNSSDEVDSRWEQLRGKALERKKYEKDSSGAMSLTSDMEDDLIRDCVETGMPSSLFCGARTKYDCQQQKCTSGEEERESSFPLRVTCTASSQQGEVRECISDGDSALSPIKHTDNTPQGGTMDQRPGQADEISIHKPTLRQVQSGISIDQETSHNVTSDTTNAPSFDEEDVTAKDTPKSIDSTDKYAVEKGACNQKQLTSQSKSPKNIKTNRAKLIERGSLKSTYGFSSEVIEEGADAQRLGFIDREEIEVTLVLSSEEHVSKMEATVSISDSDIVAELSSNDENNSKRNTDNDLQGDDSINGSAIIGENGHHDTKTNAPSDEINEPERAPKDIDDVSTSSIDKEDDLIQVKSSLTNETDLSCHMKDNEITNERPIQPLRIYTDPSKLQLSHRGSIDLSVGETIGKSFSFTSNAPMDVVPSWRLHPSDSLSDFILLILSTATGETTSYNVHKHMMAVGPRRSDYMDEVFRSEDASTFQMTLDEKTAILVPTMLDFVYSNHDINITTEMAVPLRQLGKMLKIVPLEIKAATFIIEDIEISNMSAYVSDCCFYKDEEVMKVVVQKCSASIETIPITDRLWIVMKPELFLRVVTSPNIERTALSRHLSIILKEYLELHQYEIKIDMFTTLTSEKIIPNVDRDAALPLIELCELYDSEDCETLQKRCAYTIACYWKTTTPIDRRRLFSLLRNLPSSFTVDFLEIVESGSDTHLEEKKINMEGINDDIVRDNVSKPEIMSIHDLCGESVREAKRVDKGSDEEVLSWRLDPEKSYSDWAIQINNLDSRETQVYHVHKHIIAVGSHKSYFFDHYFASNEIEARQKGCTIVEVDHEAALVVPQVLDFIYCQGHELDISDKNAVALHYVASVLGISMLSKNALEFIGKNMTLTNIATYILHANSFKDYKIIAMASQLCVQDITSINTDSELLKALEPDFFEIIVASDELDEKAKCHVTVLITQYFSLHDLEEDIRQKSPRKSKPPRPEKPEEKDVAKNEYHIKETVREKFDFYQNKNDESQQQQQDKLEEECRRQLNSNINGNGSISWGMILSTKI